MSFCYVVVLFVTKVLQWRHNDRDGVSDHRCLDCLLNRLFRGRSKKTTKPRVTGGFHLQMVCNAKNASIWWRHHRTHRREMEMSPFWRNLRHWLRRKLSKWQLSVQQVSTISSKWWHFRFSGLYYFLLTVICMYNIRLFWKVCICKITRVFVDFFFLEWRATINMHRYWSKYICSSSDSAAKLRVTSVPGERLFHRCLAPPHPNT